MKRQLTKWEKIFANQKSDKELISKICKEFTKLNSKNKYVIKNGYCGASLVVQWLRIRLPMQEPRVRALVWEDPTCRGATKPLSHNYWASALEPVSYNYWGHVPQLLQPVHLEPMLRNKRSHRNEKPRTTMKSSPRSPQLEKSPHATTKTQCIQK